MVNRLRLVLWGYAYLDDSVGWQINEGGGEDGGAGGVGRMYGQLRPIYERSMIYSMLDTHFLESASNCCLVPTFTPSHWGQTPLYQDSICLVHSCSMSRIPTLSWIRKCWVLSEYTEQCICNFPAQWVVRIFKKYWIVWPQCAPSANTQYFLNFPKKVISKC